MVGIQLRGRGLSIVSFLLLCATGVLVGGCNMVQTPEGLPTPTPYSLEVPPVPSAVASTMAGGGGGEMPTSTAVASGPIDLPGADDQLATAEAMQNSQATAVTVREAIPYPIHTNEATVVPVTSVFTDAWGSLAVATVVPVAVDMDHLFVLYAVDPEARFVVGVIVPRVLESKEPARLVTVGAGDGRITEIASYVGPSPGELALDGVFVYGADTDGEWVVWNEASSVRAHNLASGETRLLDEMPQDGPFVSFEAPQVDQGVAVWNEKRRNASPYSSARVVPAAVRWADLASGEVSTLSASGAYPAISWPVAAWLEYPASGAGVNDYSIDLMGRVMLRNLETGESWDLPDLPALAGVALDGDSLFFTSVVGQGFLTNLHGDSPRLVAPFFSSPYQQMSLNERLVTWRDQPWSPVYDRALDRLVFLAARPFGFPKIRVSNGQALAWEDVVDMVELEGKQAGYVIPADPVVYLLNTADLPK